MKLREYEGKELFATYGIAVPQSKRVTSATSLPDAYPCVLKAQTLFGDRMKYGGIIIATSKAEASAGLKKIFSSPLRGERVEFVLIEERIDHDAEYYASFSYSTEARSPVLSLARSGGSGITKAYITPIDATVGLPGFIIRDALVAAKFKIDELNPMVELILKLWNLFNEKYALLAEINPIFKTRDGRYVAGDAKIILDDEKIKPGERRFIEMDGDIAILASGGGASLLNIDSLLDAGGRPANYTEYSGNPPAEVVSELTQRVLGRAGLKGCWVIGGTANFTDIFETLRGFIDGLRLVRPKPTYPIVIRRDGPRKTEAFALLKEIGEKEGYDFHCFDSHTPMSETAKIITKLSCHR